MALFLNIPGTFHGQGMGVTLVGKPCDGRWVTILPDSNNPEQAPVISRAPVEKGFP